MTPCIISRVAANILFGRSEDVSIWHNRKNGDYCMCIGPVQAEPAAPHWCPALNAKQNRSLVVFEISWACGYVLRARLRMEI